MKWSPQPKEPCLRPDCNEPQRQWSYCQNHASLWRRNGTPYRQDEIAEMRSRNRDEEYWDSLIAEEPAVIEWTKKRGGILIGRVVHDPHADRYYAQRKAAS